MILFEIALSETSEGDLGLMQSSTLDVAAVLDPTLHIKGKLQTTNFLHLNQRNKKYGIYVVFKYVQNKIPVYLNEVLRPARNISTNTKKITSSGTSFYENQCETK